MSASFRVLSSQVFKSANGCASIGNDLRNLIAASCIGHFTRFSGEGHTIGLRGPDESQRYYSTGGESHISVIKQLRERTGAPMKDIKKVLVSSNWDLESAFTELRKQGLAAASKKKSRIASDGLLGLVRKGNKVAVVEVNSETDFVARNEIFQHLVSKVSVAALEATSGVETRGSAVQIPVESIEEIIISSTHPQIQGTKSVQDAIIEVSSITGEKVQLRRAFALSEDFGVIGTYMHTSPTAGLARMVGLVSLRCEAESYEKEKLQSMADNLAMHAVASKPLYVSRQDVPSEVLIKEREILATQAATSGKPPAVIEKMVEGRLKKYFEEFVLLEQPFLLDETKKVQAILDVESKSVGGKLSVVEMMRLEVGEGVEKIEKDFATEVLQQVKQAE